MEHPSNTMLKDMVEFIGLEPVVDSMLENIKFTMFLSAYTFLEKFSMTLCDTLRDKNKSAFSINDLKGAGIQRVISYCKKFNITF